MSRMFESMVRRGAGLSPAPGTQTLGPRPLSRFERPAPDLVGEEIAPPPLQASAPVRDGVCEAQTPPPAMIARDTAVEITHRFAADEQAAPDRAAAALGEAAAASPSPAPPRRPAAAVPALPAAAGQTPIEVAPAQERAQPTAPRQPAEARSEHAPPPRVERTVRAEPGTQIAMTNDDMPTPAAPAPMRIDRVREQPAPPLPQEPRAPLPAHQAARPMAERQPSAMRGEVEAPAPLSVSIGRIEIAFAPNPPPAAPAAPQRTRGFANFAAARRGILR